MPPFALLLALASPTGPAARATAVHRAQALYDDARYEAALEELAGGCDDADAPVACERLRAFVSTALGQAFAARAAFDRMLAIDPEASLGSDVAPKLQALFADAKQAMAELRGLRLESSAVGGGILLEAKNPSASTVESLTAHLTLPGAEAFAAVALTLEGDVWSGTLRSATDWRGGTARYYLDATLAGAAQVGIGSEESPLEIQVAGGSGGGEDGGTGTDTGEGEPAAGWDPLLVGEQNDGGLPGWAPWAIGGGVLLAVGVAVVVGVVLGTPSAEPGTVQVTVAFEGE